MSRVIANLNCQVECKVHPPQIEHSSLIAPLQALALCDPRMAALLLTEVMRAIWREGDRARTEEEQEEAGGRLSAAIEKLLGRSSLHPAPLIACCLKLVLELQPQFEVAPRKVRAAAIASGNEVLAEQVLEERIRGGDESEFFFFPSRIFHMAIGNYLLN